MSFLKVDYNPNKHHEPAAAGSEFIAFVFRSGNENGDIPFGKSPLRQTSPGARVALLRRPILRESKSIFSMDSILEDYSIYTVRDTLPLEMLS